ncbi:MAG: hypothetical protein AAFU85_32705 [Planctomycetota bacterium]
MSIGGKLVLSNLLVGFGVLWFAGCAAVPATAPATPPASAQAGATTIVAVAPPAAPSVTLPQFLGLDLVFAGTAKAVTRVRNRLSTRFPVLEPKPPVRSLSDPANLSPEASPAVQAAAKAKAEDDTAPQKAKAIKYLAGRGCGECFPETEDALIAALDDCNESIRYGVVRGLQGSVGTSCQSCRTNSCCSPKLLQKLYKVAYERDDQGCFIESSARVRRNARLVICKCGGVPMDAHEALPIEGPPGEIILGDLDAEETTETVAETSENTPSAIPVGFVPKSEDNNEAAKTAAFRLPDLPPPDVTSVFNVDE